MKEYDIRPADLFDRYLELSYQDVKTFFSDHSQYSDAPCPGCGQGSTEEAFTKASFRYVQCQPCGSLFISPRPSPEMLDAFYTHSPAISYFAETFFPAVAEARRQEIFGPRVDQLASLFQKLGFKPQTLIEVGAGFGIFLEEFKKQFPTTQVKAVEPSFKFAEICRQKGFEALQTSAEKSHAWAGQADFVACFEVMEHVYSLETFVRACVTLLKPGGYLLLTGLGADGFDIQVLWSKSKSVSPPNHLNFLSVQGMGLLLKRVGLSDIQISTPGQLDLDIVHNEWKTDPSLLEQHRFFRLLLSKRGPTVQENFQQFLSKNQLSSHMWALARK